jgi:NAD(P)-dependent dehydrogenase (short-subunit alcohol dehydrogenase family)
VPDPAHPLKDRHAVVTGAGSGIGAATAKRLDALGACVTLIGRDRVKLKQTAAALQHAWVAPADISDEKALRAALNKGRAHFGPVAILINNAGVAPSAPFLKTSRQTLDAVMAVNLTGAFLASQLALPDMLLAGSGRIVNVASTAALEGYPYVSAYVASKHALLGLTRSLALEVGRKGVTVNAVCPGFVDTDIVARSIETITARTGRSAEEARAELAAANAGGRILSAEEVADVIGRLCLDQSSAINGEAVPVSGGES